MSDVSKLALRVAQLERELRDMTERAVHAERIGVGWEKRAEKERMRVIACEMAACHPAQLRDMHPDYDSASRKSITATMEHMTAEVASLEREREAFVDAVRAHNAFHGWCATECCSGEPTCWCDAHKLYRGEPLHPSRTRPVERAEKAEAEVARLREALEQTAQHLHREDVALAKISRMAHDGFRSIGDAEAVRVIIRDTARAALADETEANELARALTPPPPAEQVKGPKPAPARRWAVRLSDGSWLLNVGGGTAATHLHKKYQMKFHDRADADIMAMTYGGTVVEVDEDGKEID